MYWSEQADSQFGVRLNARQLEAFDWYAAELQSWNQRFNLTSVTDREQIEIKHFLDSLSCLRVMHPEPGARIVDIGTGAGFPGIPIRIACPLVHMVLVESIGKKVANLPTLLEYLLPLVKVGGGAIAQKGDTAPAEAQSARVAMGVLGGELTEIIPVELPGVAETRHLIAIRKSAATPEKYPRRPGVPGKRPL